MNCFRQQSYTILIKTITLVNLQRLFLFISTCALYYVSKVIVEKVEYSQLNKLELTFEKDVCIPFKVDRLGNITYIGTEFLPKRGL